MKVVETRSRKWLNTKFKNSLSFSKKTRNFLGLFMFLFLRKWNLIEIVSTRTHHITSFHFKELEFYLVWYYYYISMVISPLRIRQTIPFSHLNYASSWLIFEEEKIQFNVNVYRFCCCYLFKRNECKQTPLQQWQPQKNRNSVYVCVCVMRMRIDYKNSCREKAEPPTMAIRVRTLLTPMRIEKKNLLSTK